MQKKILSYKGWKYNLLYIFIWYFFSTSLSIYNKTLMGKENYNFNLPLLMSAVHAGIHTIITRILIIYSNQKVETYSTVDYLLKVVRLFSFNFCTNRINHSNETFQVPCGMAAAVEICCANASLVFITLSFYTMIKSSTPVWVLLFSFLFGFEKPKLNLILIISIIVFGVWLTIDGEPKVHYQGFILVLIAAIASGLRWNMTQYLMKNNNKTQQKVEQQQQHSPISTMYHTSPVMFITMLLLSLYIENPFQQQPSGSYFDSLLWRSIISLCIMAVGGILGKQLDYSCV